MKEPVARGRGASVFSVSSTSSVFIRPTIDAILLVLVLPLALLIVVLVPWDEFDWSSPHVQLLGIALLFASVLLCLKMACSACPDRFLIRDSFSRRNSQQGLLSSIEDGPPNYESIMINQSPQNTLVVVTTEPEVSQSHADPPPYHAIIINPEGSHQENPTP